MIQHYELMFIIPGSIDAAAVKPVQERVFELIKQANATMSSQYDMGRRKLAYKIKQQTYGHYYVLQFDAEAEVIKDLDTKLRLDHEILRYMLVKGKPLTNEQLKAMIEEPEKEEVEPAEEMSDISGALPAEPQVQVQPVVKSATEVKVEAEPVTEVAEPETVTTEVVEESIVTEVAEPEVAESTPTPESEVMKSKLTMEELDKKLEDILGDTDLESQL
ncbi:MAG: 30S ribosomal protein S6 [bacterium]|nr:30S ribosomal protein S6 [bacterium]